MTIKDRQLEKDARDSIVLPCILPVPPIYYKDGFMILRACINITSKQYPNIHDQIPPEWRPEEARLGSRRGNNPFAFSIRMNSDTIPSPDVPYQFVGKIENHPRYGRQFNAYNFFVDEPSDRKMMEIYLQRMPQVQAVRAKEIVDKFGVEHIPHIMEHDWIRLVEIRGITERRARGIHEIWEEDTAHRAVCMWLIKHNVSAFFGKKIIEKFKTKAMEVLKENPYALTQIRGIGFKTADQIAHKLFDDIPRDLRAESCVEWYLEQQKSAGHTCLPFHLMCQEVNKILMERNDSDYTQEIKTATLEVCHRVHWKTTLSTFVYLPGMFQDEHTCAQFIYNMSQLPSPYDFEPEDLERAEQECKRYLSMKTFTFDPQQRRAIESAFTNKLTVLTGGGGTGKSTICRAICQIAESKNLNVTLFAPTGQAAKVLQDKTGCPASTIHRGLGILPDGSPAPRQDSENDADSDGQGSYNAIPPGILIIDEFSMVGTDLFAHISRAVERPEVTNVVFVGDPQQLPSVSPGNNLKDVIECGQANVVKLEQIYRQGENSHIPIIANQIARGEIPEIPENSDDFVWVDAIGDEAHAKVMAIVNHYHKQGRMKDVHTLSPVYKRKSGVNFLNCAIQEGFTSSENPSLIFGEELAKVNLGDRVMQTVNDYDKNVFNGNIGYVKAYYDDNLGVALYDRFDPVLYKPEISRSGSDKTDEEVESGMWTLENAVLTVEKAVDEEQENRINRDRAVKSACIEYEEGGGTVRSVRYYDEEIPALKLAWCSTVHKFQGAQMPVIVFVMTSDLHFVLSRELVYTAMTRAQERLFVIGDRRMLTTAAERSVIRTRYTHLVTFINILLGKEERPIVKAPRRLLRQRRETRKTGQ